MLYQFTTSSLIAPQGYCYTLLNKFFGSSGHFVSGANSFTVASIESFTSIDDRTNNNIDLFYQNYFDATPFPVVFSTIVNAPFTSAFYVACEKIVITSQKRAFVMINAVEQASSVTQIIIYEVIPSGPSSITIKTTNLHSYKVPVADYFYAKYFLHEGLNLRLYYSFAAYGIWDQTPMASNIKTYIHKY